MQVYIEKRDSHKQRKTKTKNGKQKQKTCIGYKNKCSITFSNLVIVKQTHECASV